VRCDWLGAFRNGQILDAAGRSDFEDLSVSDENRPILDNVQLREIVPAPGTVCAAEGQQLPRAMNQDTAFHIRQNCFTPSWL
jgi:hypothetical protein